MGKAEFHELAPKKEGFILMLWKCEYLEAPTFQAKVAFIFEFLNYPIVEMLCPSAPPRWPGR